MSGFTHDWYQNHRIFCKLQGSSFNWSPIGSPAFSERLGLPVTHSASLWADWPPCERPSLLVRGRSPCEMPGLPVRGPASLWEARPCLWEALLMRGPASLWEAQYPCERPVLSVRPLENQKKNRKLPFCCRNYLQCFFSYKNVFTHIGEARLD